MMTRNALILAVLTLVLSGCATPPAVREVHEARDVAAVAGQGDSVRLALALVDDLQTSTLQHLLTKLDLLVAKRAVDGKVSLADYEEVRKLFAVGLTEWRKKRSELQAKVALSQINHTISDELSGILGMFLGRSGMTLTDEDKARLMKQVGAYAKQVEANKEAERQREHELEIEALKAKAAEGGE